MKYLKGSHFFPAICEHILFRSSTYPPTALEWSVLSFIGSQIQTSKITYKNNVERSEGQQQ